MKLQDRNLNIRMRGKDVELLQQELRQLDFVINDEAGYFGSSTRRAVEQFQEQHGLKMTGVVDERTATLINEAVQALDPEPESDDTTGSFVVRGHVRKADGSPVEGVIVKAFDKDLRREQLLGETTTDSEGKYAIQYTLAQLSRPGKSAADLLARGYDQEGNEISTSPLILEAAAEQTVDLVVGNEAYRGPSEYTQLSTKLEPLLSEVNAAELTEEEIAYLSGKTRLDPIHITDFVRSAQLEKRNDIQSEILYGLFRQNLPTEWAALLAQDSAVLRQALKSAVKENIISAQFGEEEQIEQLLERWRQSIVEHAFEQPDEEGKTFLGALLATTIDEPERQKELVTLYVNHEGSIETFWNNLSENPDFMEDVDNLKFALQVGALTKNHLRLVSEIQRLKREHKPVKRDQQITTLRDLTLFNEDDWKQIISKDDIGFPPDVPGENDEEKAQNYASAIARMMEDNFPTAFVANRIAEDEITGRDDLLTFFKNNEDFEFISTRLETHLSENDSVLDGIENKEALKNNIKCMQRLYKVVPNYAPMRVLMKDGLDSAHAITRMGPTVFMAKYCESLTNMKTDPMLVYEKAEQTSATALVLLSGYGMVPSKVSFNAVPDKSPQQVAGIPDWPTLFGALEVCECEHCRSVYSPAAYLVDVLHFLKDRRLVDKITRDKKSNRITKVTYKTKNSNGKQVDKSAKDVLFERRSDIGTIELTCENINTHMPYVDLVNEVLENGVAPLKPFKPFNLSSTLESDLDKRNLSTNLRNEFKPPNPSLSSHAIITIKKKGIRWTIDDLAFTYTIRKESGQLRVMARSLQTSGTAQERAANPQYVNPDAYTKLKQQVFPWSLPFDLWMEETRAYLGHLGVQRYELMETFLKADHKKIRTDLLTNKNIAREYLGITVGEANLINGATTSQAGAAYPGEWNLWGFNKEKLDKQNPIPDPADSTKWIDKGHWVNDVVTKRVDVFLQQSGIKYIELLDLLGTHYINPLKNDSRKIHIESSDPKNQDTCELVKLRLAGFDKTDALRTSRFVRLWRQLGWTMHDLDKAITALKPVDLDDDFLTQLSHIKRLHSELDSPITAIISFWADIDTVVYIEHSAAWQPNIPSMYEQLFRNKAVINPLDPDFTEDPKKLKGKLSEHVPTITAALGISAADFTLLVNAKTIPDDKLNLENLSRLYRHATLAKALNLTIRNYLSCLKLIGATPVYPFTTTIETVLFVERVGKIRSSGFTIAELNYLLRHEVDASSGVSPTDDLIGLILDEIRSGLQTIFTENTFVDDPDNPNGVTTDLKGDLTRKKLSLLRWDNTVVERAISMLNGVAIYEAPLNALANGIAFPNKLKRRISYDSDRKKLQFVGFMTVAEKALLLAIPQADTVFKVAVDILFIAPTKFISRNMRTFSVKTFEESLKVLPAKIKFPDALKSRIYYDATTKKVYFIGAMTDSEKAILLGLSNDQSYQTAIKNLFKALDTLAPQPGDSFLTTSGPKNDANILFETLSTPGARFEHLLKKIMPHLRNLLSERLVKQKLGEALKLEAEVVDQLLTKYVNSPNQPARKSMTDFLADAFVESNLKVKLKRGVFQDQFNTFTLLHKIALIITKFKITSKQIKWILEYGPGVDWLDLNALPLSLSPPNAALFKAWERLVDLFHLRDALPLGETVLDNLFKIALSVKPNSSSAAKTKYIDALAKELKWSEKNLESLLGKKTDHLKKGTLNVSFPEDYQDERSLRRLHSCFKMLKRLGMSAEKCSSLTQTDLRLEARGVIQAVKAKYSDKQWLKIAKPLRDALREKQRAALVAYLVTHPSTIKKPGGTSQPAWRNVNGLYAYFLIDVEMSPCQMTSRIKQAMSSTQLFVQRCLMNLESDVSVSAEIDMNWRQWKWMKNYRVWEANRKVFLYPENWIEPELRDDKSPFFKELESELLQNDITKDTAETVFLHYIEKLDAVARLEIVGMYHQVETDDKTLTGKKMVDILHVFGRTPETPHIYYYRQRVDSAYWTSWERVDLDIEGDHLIPVVWNRRLHLFWPIFTERQDKKAVKMPAENKEMEEGKKYWEIQLAWSEYTNGKWSTKKITSTSIQSYAVTPNPKREDKDKSKYVFRAYPDSDGLRLWYDTKVASSIEPFAVKSFVHVFNFTGCNGEVSIRDDMLVFGTYKPNGTKLKGMMFAEKPESALFLPHSAKEVVALAKTPGNDPFRVLYPYQDEELTGERPFFFQDDTRTFFINPLTEKILFYASSPQWSDNPVMMDDQLKKYLEKPKVKPGTPFPELGGLVVDPRDPLVFKQSFPVVTGIHNARDITDGAIPFSGKIADTARAGVNPNPANEMMLLRSMTTASTDDAGRSFVLSGNGTALGSIRYPSKTPLGYFFEKRYLFQMFYHPYVCTFIRHLKRDGIDGLLQRSVQLQLHYFFDDKKNGYAPTDIVVKGVSTKEEKYPKYPKEEVDFTYDGAYTPYNWELFLHAPLLIADRLSKNQRFEEAQKWFHYIFDPTDASGYDVPQCFWRTKPFFMTTDEQHQKERIPNLLRFLAKRGDPQELAKLTQAQIKELETLESAVREWRKKPFKPHLIARMRTTAYQKTVVMKYLDNLIAWGDQLFRRDTIESINEATQLYILAAEILGKRPELVPPRAIPEVQTYDLLEPRLDAFSSALVQIEAFVPPSSGTGTFPKSTQPSLPQMLYFCIPKNDKLLGYWDTVADRLFKIRHCMNIAGVVRQLPLFAPPIDPGLLVKAAAAGIDINSALNDINAALPNYRFNVMQQKAVEICNELKALGSALLSVLEKRDAETLALLRSTHEIKVLNAVRLIKLKQIDEAKETWKGLKLGKEVISKRRDFYKERLDVKEPEKEISESSRPPSLSDKEQEQQSDLETARDIQIAQIVLQFLAGGSYLIPDFKQGSPPTVGMYLGGKHLGGALQSFAAGLGTIAAKFSAEAQMSGIMAGYERREEEWRHQFNLAIKEIKQIDEQIAAAEIRKAIADRELKNHDLQVKNTKKVDAYMQDKYTNKELYDWMIGQISAIYFQSYQLAYDIAKRVERAYRYELGLQDSNFIQFGYWDSLKKGLLAGERLHYDLKRMDAAYLEQNKREYEITKHISLTMIDPIALIMLKEKGECYVNLPEAIFDLDYPGHYMRRIKSVSLTIPCVTGPYTSVNCTLTLLSNRIRKDSSGIYDYKGVEDKRFQHNFGAIQSIATSSAQNDSGLFELNFRDERYLPFEGAGVISEWRLELPEEFRQFDYDTISDVIFHINYTARDGGGTFKKAVNKALGDALKKMKLGDGRTGLMQVFSAKHEFSNAWHQFLHPRKTDTAQALKLDLDQSRFPSLFKDKTIKIKTMHLFIKLKNGYTYQDSSPLKFDLKSNGGSYSGQKKFQVAGSPVLNLTYAKPFENQSQKIGKWSIKVDLTSLSSELCEDVKIGNVTIKRLKPDAFEDLIMVCRYTAEKK